MRRFYFHIYMKKWILKKEDLHKKIIDLHTFSLNIRKLTKTELTRIIISSHYRYDGNLFQDQIDKEMLESIMKRWVEIFKERWPYEIYKFSFFTAPPP